MTLNKVAYFLSRLATSLTRIANGVGISILLALMGLTVLNVFLRYFFKAPLLGAYEITELAMVVIVFLAIGYTMAKKAHVGIDILVSRLPAEIERSVSCATALLSLWLFSLITYRSVIFAKEQLARGVTSAALLIPVYPFLLLVAFGSALMSLVLLSEFITRLAALLNRRGWQVWFGLTCGIGLTILVMAVPIVLRQLPVKINTLTAGYIGTTVMILFLFSGMPVGFVMALVGFLGMTYLGGPETGMALLGRVPYSTVANEGLSVIPLFILMGLFVYHAGISKDLYYAAYKWVGHFPGGLAMATIGACAAFGAVCGSSPATAATMGTVVLPEMKLYKYDPALATGSVAAGGTLGILIPPSIAFAVYGLISEQSIGKLFLAGIFPGVLLSILFVLVIYFAVRRNLTLGPPANNVGFSKKLKSLKRTWGVLVLFFVVIGGLYLGLFTPTEGAAIGAFGALLFAMGKRRLTWGNLSAALLESGKTTAMILTIIVGATIFASFLTVTQLPMELAATISALPVSRYVVLSVIILVYIFLGCIMEGISIIILTVPIALPIMNNLGFDPIWFGVIVVICSEMGLITPPVGVNAYIIAGIAQDVPMFTVFRGILPFFLAMIICVVILAMFPEIALLLPNLMSGG